MNICVGDVFRSREFEWYTVKVERLDIEPPPGKRTDRRWVRIMCVLSEESRCVTVGSLLKLYERVSKGAAAPAN